MEHAALVEGAKAVLERNWVGHATRPGPHLYPHQWSWDAAFIAIGYAHYDSDRAYTELRSLFDGQWRSGLLPHIVFHPTRDEYFPGPSVWATDESLDAPALPRTSGIVQPPLHATAARFVHERAADRRWSLAILEELFPKLVAWHKYLYRDRDPGRTGLVALRHPWESGQDDSPAWDDALARITLPPGATPPYRRVDLTRVAAHERPTVADYDHYVFLVECFKRAGYDEALMRELCPFCVEDVLFNSALVQAGEDLAAIAEELGEDPAPFREQASRTSAAIEERLWDEAGGRYISFDRHGEASLPAWVSAGFIPLFAGVPSPDRAARLAQHLESPEFWFHDGGYPVPSHDRLAPSFDRRRYWRGPVWVNVNWLIWRGLRRYGFDEQAEQLRAATLELVTRSGFREYFDAETGEGLGSEEFSWTAALVLNLVLGGQQG